VRRTESVVSSSSAKWYRNEFALIRDWRHNRPSVPIGNGYHLPVYWS
jgi:hypothetical protein